MTIEAIASDDAGHVFVVHEDGSVTHYDMYEDDKALFDYVDKVMSHTIFTVADELDDVCIQLLERHYDTTPHLRLLAPSWDLQVPDNLAARLLIAACYLRADSKAKADAAMYLARECGYLEDRWVRRWLTHKPHISIIIDNLTT
ncbi:MAG: hypothetical protein D6790_15000 [Caldilineae bacterium]|nr:MAG: hypothetical protein D6790_15000 [Caldilineae bacterium]